jgi:hypothetical protein
MEYWASKEKQLLFRFWQASLTIIATLVIASGSEAISSQGDCHVLPLSRESSQWHCDRLADFVNI